MKKLLALLMCVRDYIVFSVMVLMTIAICWADTLNAQRLLLSANLLSDNSNINVSEVYEENGQIVNDIFLKTLAVDIDTFTTGQITDLEDIANQCPLSGGDAVYQARALLGDGAVYDDVDMCTEEQEELKRPDLERGFTFALSPNPARDYVMVELDDKLGEGATLSVFNALGLEVLQEKALAGVREFPMLLEDLPVGVYQLTIHNARQEIHSESFIIIK